MIGVIPASWILNKYGLRFSILLGASGTAIGSWIKCASVDPSRFWLTMTGQSIVAASQLFILHIPSRLAAVWFGSHEVSRATSVGVFGNQVGIALGFLLPPFIIRICKSVDPSHTHHHLMANSTDIDSDRINEDEVSDALSIMFYGVAVVTTIILVMMIIFFDEKPKKSPSVAVAMANDQMASAGYKNTLKTLLSSKNFILLLISYGLNVGVFYGISTVLNDLITTRFGGTKDTDAKAAEDAGLMGHIMVIAGIFGSVVGGAVLDATKKFKETTMITYILSLMGMIMFGFSLKFGEVIWPLFIVSALLGFAMTGYLPIGIEFAAEISYPHPEGTSAGLLNCGAQIFGMALTFGPSALINYTKDNLACSILYMVALMIGTVLTAMIKPELKRQMASSSPHESFVSPSDVSKHDMMLDVQNSNQIKPSQVISTVPGGKTTTKM